MESDLQKRRKAMFRNVKRFTALLLVLILAASTFAFAAANTVPETSLGYGTDTIAGYTVTLVQYTPLATDMSKLSIVSFTITANNNSDTHIPDVLMSTDPTIPTVTASYGLNTCAETATGTGYVWTVVCTYTSGSEPTIASATALHILASTRPF